MTRLRLLFIHTGLPAQYVNILPALAKEGHELVGIGLYPLSAAVPNTFKYFRYKLNRENTAGIHPWALDIETKVIRGEACAKAAHQLKTTGFKPDLICGHPGWGEMLFLKDVWPDSPQLTYQEFFYNAEGFDSHFDPELQPLATWQSTARLHIKAANSLLSLERSNWSVCPTTFQRSSFPKEKQPRMSVIHDGIDTEQLKPATLATRLELPGGITLDSSTPIVTFVNRRLEPYRGAHTMIRAIPSIQASVPNAHIVLVGDTQGTSYGKSCPEGEWKDYFLAEIEGQYDPQKVHFTGSLAYQDYLHVIQHSWVHVYLTYPFVLSWSMLEAMSCGCAVVGSDTAPVREVIEHKKNGLLVDFFNSEQLASTTANLLQDRKYAKALGVVARQTVLQRYERNQCVQQHIALIKLVASGALGADSKRSHRVDL